MLKEEIRHFHLFCGLGSGAAGFNDAHARVGKAEAVFRCIGGIDNDPSAISDFSRNVAGRDGTIMDLFSRSQYERWHGHEPPAGWKEATPADIRNAAGNERPHVVFTSSPCKGLSSLLTSKRAATEKYEALNELTVRGVHLTLEAWKDDPPEFILFENVPQIATRGRQLLDVIQTLLGAYGYAVAETTHCCGELGGLAQRRKRFLLVARHIEKVPPFLYEPERRPLRSIGEVLSELPLPGDVEAGGPMHRMPRLQWQTWVRLALIPAGKDWRSLQDLRVEDGTLSDFGIDVSTRYHRGVYGVSRWGDTSGTVTGQNRPTNGCFSIADPRCPTTWGTYSQLGVRKWDETSGTITSQRSPGQGYFSIADPRAPSERNGGKYFVAEWSGNSRTVLSGSTTGQGAFGVSDPREDLVAWSDPAPFEKTDKGVFCIISADGTWHRPFTTLETAALQGIVKGDEFMELTGASDMAKRERIGNAVPRPASAAIGSVIGQTLLLAWAGETFTLSSQPIWVRPIAQAIAVDTTGPVLGMASH